MRFWGLGPPFSGILSTKSGFLCAFGLWNPLFRAFRAQNRGFCAFLAFGTRVFGLFEHKIGVFVRFWLSKPPFSGFSSTKSAFLCSSYWGCWPGCGKSGLWESNIERWELKSRIGKGRVTLWVHRMCCGKQIRRFWKEKSAQLWGLRAFTICFAARATLRKGITLRTGAILPRAGLNLPAGQGYGRLPVLTAWADCVCQPTGRG